MSEEADEVDKRRLAEALAALREWVSGGDYGKPTALGNALSAIHALRSSRVRRLGDGGHLDQARADPDGQVLEGLVWVRGAGGHGRAYGALIEGTRPFRLNHSELGGGDTLQGPGVRLVWRSVADLPGRGGSREGRQLYERRVAGREVLETFAEAARFLGLG